MCLGQVSGDSGKPLNIRTANTGDRNAWDAYVLNHPLGIAYQLFAWKDAVKRAYGFNAVYLIAEENHSIKGILPLICFHLPLKGTTLISLPYCDAGGPLADSVEIEKQLLLKALDVSRHSPKNNGMVTIRSTQSFAGIDPDLTLKRDKVRMVLDLPDSSISLLKSLKAKVRSQARKPERDGLTAQIGGKELLHLFYPLFAENMRDLGSPVHSRKWIQSIFQAYGNRAQLVLVRLPDKTPAAGGVLLCHDRTVSVPWASSLGRFNRWNPNMLLYWSFLKFASDNGYQTFDFGRSTPGEGTFRFKKQWGAEPFSLHWADFSGLNVMGGDVEDGCESPMPVAKPFSPSSESTRSTGPIEPMGHLRRAGESFFVNLPISFSKAVGPLLRRNISL